MLLGLQDTKRCPAINFDMKGKINRFLSVIGVTHVEQPEMLDKISEELYFQMGLRPWCVLHLSLWMSSSISDIGLESFLLFFHWNIKLPSVLRTQSSFVLPVESLFFLTETLSFPLMLRVFLDKELSAHFVLSLIHWCSGILCLEFLKKIKRMNAKLSLCKCMLVCMNPECFSLSVLNSDFINNDNVIVLIRVKSELLQWSHCNGITMDLHHIIDFRISIQYLHR